MSFAAFLNHWWNLPFLDLTPPAAGGAPTGKPPSAPVPPPVVTRAGRVPTSTDG